MTATVLANKQIVVSDATADAAQRVEVPRGATVALRAPSGDEVMLPGDVQELILRVLESLVHDGSVSVGRLPQQLTSTVAAEVLGVSRPTLMKWAREGVIDSFKVGSHTRFHRDEVARVVHERRVQRRAAFDELRELEAEHEHQFDD